MVCHLALTVPLLVVNDTITRKSGPKVSAVMVLTPSEVDTIAPSPLLVHMKFTGHEPAGNDAL